MNKKDIISRRIWGLVIQLFLAFMVIFLGLATKWQFFAFPIEGLNKIVFLIVFIIWAGITFAMGLLMMGNKNNPLGFYQLIAFLLLLFFAPITGFLNSCVLSSALYIFGFLFFAVPTIAGIIDFGTQQINRPAS